MRPRHHPQARSPRPAGRASSAGNRSNKAMPDKSIYTIEKGGQIYKVEASSDAEALAAVDAVLAAPAESAAPRPPRTPGEPRLSPERREAKMLRDLAQPSLIPQSTVEGDPGYLAMAKADPKTYAAKTVSNIGPSAMNLFQSVPGMVYGVAKFGLDAMTNPAEAFTTAQGAWEGLEQRYGGAEDIVRTVMAGEVGGDVVHYGCE